MENWPIICQLINVQRAHLASCTSHEDGTSTQQTVSCVLNILAVYLVSSSGVADPFTYKRGVGDVTAISGLSCGEWSYLWLILEHEGNGIAFCTLHKYETTITTERPFSVCSCYRT